MKPSSFFSDVIYLIKEKLDERSYRKLTDNKVMKRITVEKNAESELI